MAGSKLLAQGIDRRRAILKFIKAYVKKNHISPSVTEVADGVGIGRTAARYHVGVLQEEKFVAMTDGKYRSLRVINDGRYPAPASK